MDDKGVKYSFRGVGEMRYRMKDRFFGLRIAGAVVFFALAPSLAWSYIDPGNGAYVVQLLFTLVGAALFYIRHPVRFFYALRNWLFRRDSGGTEPLGEAAELNSDVESVSAQEASGRSE